MRLQNLRSGKTIGCLFWLFVCHNAVAITIDGPFTLAADFGPPTTDMAFFGAALTLNGDMAVISSPHQTGFAGDVNFADIFQRNHSGDWSFSSALPHVLDIATTNLYFTGNSIVMDSTTVLLGEEQADIWPNQRQGEIDVYPLASTGWHLQDNVFDYETGSFGDRLGGALAISGNVLAAGAASDETLTGAAYILARDGDSWHVQQRLAPTDSAVGDRFGSALAIDGNALVVGAPVAAYAGQSAGAAYVYNFNGSRWVQTQKLVSTNPTDGGSFGGKVTVSGNWMAVSAPLEYASGKFYGGHVYIYQRTGSTWALRQDLTSMTPSVSDGFGGAIDLKGQTLVVGALGSSSASVYRLTSSTWSRIATMTDSAGSEFGAAVAISASDGEIMIGAPTESSNTGHAYIFSGDEIFSNGYE